MLFCAVSREPLEKLLLIFATSAAIDLMTAGERASGQRRASDEGGDAGGY